MNRDSAKRALAGKATGCAAQRAELGAADAASDPPAPQADCEVRELDADVGQALWDALVYVQEFTDSVLDTLPGPLLP